MAKDVYEYIVHQKNAYKTDKIPLDDQWSWNMYEHIRKCFLYKNSKFYKGSNEDGMRPFNNIILPIVNFAYRTEGFNVTDVSPYVDSEKDFYKSFFVKKYYPKWARANNLDDVIDTFVEEYVDYGLAVLKNVGDKKPDNVPLQKIAFCDQTNFQTGAVCEKHSMTVEEIRGMKGKWNDSEIENLINLSEPQRESNTGNQQVKTTSKYIEVFELHGELPGEWLDENKEGEVIRQMQVVAFYKDKRGKENGVTLFKGKEKENIYVSEKRDSVYGRACGRSAIEELFDPQTWTNYSEIKIKDMLDNAALMVYASTDPKFKQNNNVQGLVNGEVLTLEDGDIKQLANNVSNITAFENTVNKWELKSRNFGSVSETGLGENPASGTPFALQQLVNNESKGIHIYRQEKITRLWERVHKNWILKYIVDEINSGQKFIEDLSVEELEAIGEQLATNVANEKIKENMMKNWKPTTPEEQAVIKEVVKTSFQKGGKKRFLEILKDEIKDIPVDVEISIKNKQKDLFGVTQKLVDIFRQIIAAPDILKAPGMKETFNQIIEYSGFSPFMFRKLTNPANPSTQASEGQTKPLEQLSEQNLQTNTA